MLHRYVHTVMHAWTYFSEVGCMVICLQGKHCVDSFAGSLVILGPVDVLVDIRD